MSSRVRHAFLGALANKGRFAILLALREKEMSVTELTDRLGMRQSTISHCLQRLVADKLVHARPEGTFRIYSLRSPTVRALLSDIERFTAASDAHGPALERERAERRAVEHRLEEREEELRGILDHAPVTISINDDRGVYTAIAGDIMRRFKVREEDVLGKSVFDIYPEGSLVRDNMRRALAGEEVRWTLESAGFVFEVFSVPVKDDVGKVKHVLSITLDVTEWVRTKKPGSTLEDMGFLSERPFDLYVVVNRSDVILSAGSHGSVPLAGKPLVEVVPGCAGWDFRDALKAVLHGGDRREVRLEADLDGSKRWYKARLVPVWQHGAVYAVAIAFSKEEARP